MAKSISKESTADEKIVEQAHKEFERDFEYESEAREMFKVDLRFANGDPDNKFQWDADYVKSREQGGRPCLTINKVKQHNRQITNEARQNKPSVKVFPVDDRADKKVAEIFNGIIRHIESNSSADTAYDMAEDFAVDAGIGYWRVITDYASDDSFDQEIFIENIKNPLNVLIDSTIQKPDGSDAKRAFIFSDMEKDEFESQYPDCEAVSWPINDGDDWLRKDSIRVAEYFKVSDKKDTLYALPDGTTVKKSELKAEDAKYVEQQVKAGTVKSRPIKSKAIMWYKIAGDQIIDRKEWPGIYIPIVRVIGEEKEIDGKLDRKGHTRPMKDAQRMYNYYSSASVEYGALQTKAPVEGPAEAFEGYEQYWNNANTENVAYLPWNHVDEAGNPLPRPQRMIPPTSSQLYLQGMEVASNEMNMSSGQYDAQFGNNPNAQSGKALNALQRKGDTATFHFIDNVSRAIKYTGMILVDLIPKIYDTQRIVRILGEDGSQKQATLDPSMQQAYANQKNPQTGAIEEIFNPTVGRYDVTVAVGPSYTTRRQEAFDALNELTARNPRLMEVAGDIIMKAADFPMADELAERLKKTLPPELRDEDDSELPEVQAVKQQAQQVIEKLTQQLDAAHSAMQEADQEAKALKDAADSKEADRVYNMEKLRIDAFNAETNRLKVQLDSLSSEGGPLDPNRIEMLEQAIAHLINSIGEPMSEEMLEPPEMQQEQPEPAPAGFLTPGETE